MIPTYNHGQFVQDAIDSILKSNFVDPEIIVVNDGSPDNTAQLIANDPRIEYYEQSNQGAHAAINFGLGKASNDIVAILNDDDLYHPNHLIEAILTLQSCNADIFLGRAEPFGGGPLLEAMREHIRLCDERIAKYGLFETLTQLNFAVSTSAFVMKKDIYLGGKGFIGLTMCHDFEFLFSSIMNQDASIYYSSSPSWKYRAHGSNTSGTITAQESAAQWYYALFSNLVNAPEELEIAIERYSSNIGLNKSNILAISTIINEYQKQPNMLACIEQIKAYVTDAE